MTSNYRQSSYELPYSGLVPSAAALGDDFAVASPQLFVLDEFGQPTAQPIPGYAALASQWSFSYVGGLSAFRGVNTRVKAAELGIEVSWSSEGSAWITQPLPPLVVGVPQELAIYGRTTPGPMQPQLDGVPGDLLFEPWAHITHGLYVGPDSPAEGGGMLLAQEFGFTTDSSRNPYVRSGLYDVSSSAKVGLYWTIDGTLYTYYRVRLSQTLNAGGFLFQRASFECGNTGADWVTFEEWQYVDFADAAYKRVGFLVNAMPQGYIETGTVRASALCDFIRVVEQPYGDPASAIGGSQQLGAV